MTKTAIVQIAEHPFLDKQYNVGSPRPYNERKLLGFTRK
jgi:hypothetical protein